MYTLNDEVIAMIKNNLPHGSGVNYDWMMQNKSVITEEGRIIGVEYIFSNKYDTMTEFGMYCCVIPFNVSVEVKFNDSGELDFTCRLFSVENVDCKVCGGTADVEDYLADLFYIDELGE